MESDIIITHNNKFKKGLIKVQVRLVCYAGYFCVFKIERPVAHVLKSISRLELRLKLVMRP